MIHLIWFHGWGFDGNCFSSLIDHLPQFHHHHVERGYFTAPNPAPVILNEPTIAIGHSLGFANLLESSIPVQGYISLSGFYQFCATPSWPWGVASKVVERMIHKFQENPGMVLKDFYRQCDVPFPAPTSYQQDPLAHDLKRLQSLNLSRDTPHLLGAIAGALDRITPLSLHKNMFKDLIIIPESGHLPWINQGPLCAHYIKTMVQRSQ